MATTKHVAYSAKVTLYFDYDGNRDAIAPNKISYIMIDHDYDNNVLPIIYITLLANDNLYSKINKYKDIGKFILTIKKYSKNSNSPIEKTLLSDSFSYIPSTSTVNYKEELNQYAPNDDSYKEVLIALMPNELINKSRKSFNGIYKNITESSLVSLALEGTDPIIQSLTYNKKYDSIIIPPITTRYKLLEYIFNKDPFYDTAFRFYIDFENTYLLSKNGKYVSDNSGKPNSILIDIGSILDRSTLKDGFDISDDHYRINVIPSSTNILSNNVTNRKVSDVTIIDKDNNLSNLDIDNDIDIEGITSKQVFVYCNNPDIVKNELELGQTIIELTKTYLDPTIITPNKIINVTNYGQNSIHDGQYLLMYKKEVYIPKSQDFTIVTALGLKKLGKLNQSVLDSKSGKSTYTKKENKAVKSSARKTTSAAMKKSVNSRLAK